MKKLLSLVVLVCCFGCQRSGIEHDPTIHYFATNINGTDIYVTVDTKGPHVFISTNFPVVP